MSDESSRKRKWCPHCKEYVSRSTYFRHLALSCIQEEDRDDSEDDLDTGDDVFIDASNDVSEIISTDGSLIKDNGFSSDSSNTDSQFEEIHQTEIDEDTSSSEDELAEQADISKLHSPSLQVLFIFIIIWQFTFNISNAAILSLLKFFRYFFGCLGKAYNYKPVEELGKEIPLSLSSFHKAINLQKESFYNYVVCQTCKSVYDFDDCIKRKANGTLESKECMHVMYPNHPHLARRKPCSTVLLKRVKIKKGYILRPKMVYPYQSLKSSIQRLVNKRRFVESCEQWRSRLVPSGYMCDIYDGSLWSDFNSSEKNFLIHPYCYMLTLNVDWFQPFDRRVYSVGVIYLTIQNLPRDQRYKIENLIIVGIIPGPDEPKKVINSFLAPLVVELQEAWDSGFLLQFNRQTICVKLALTCVTSDIPATRKVCGFLSFNAELGCNKCLKKFKVGFGQGTDFSGYSRETFINRTNSQHRENVNNVLSKSTKTAQMKAESEHGVRYSVLLDLPYFDPIRFVSIDVMHNLYLGTAKHCVEVWIEKDILTKNHLKNIERKINVFCLPTGIGRIPSGISSTYGSFTADQWRNWITIYSPILLKNVIPADHLRCWLLFVHACSILSHNFIRQCDAECADSFLHQFCQQYQRLYGNSSCTINMHLHLHLKKVFEDFGPPHTTWCYPFERFNGVLGSYHTNKKQIETQIIKKFHQAQSLHNLNLPTDDEFLSTFCKPYMCNTTATSSFHLYEMATHQVNGIESFACLSGVELLSPYYEKVLTNEQFQWIKNVYEQLYPNKENIQVSVFYKKYGRIKISNDLIGSVMPGKHATSSAVIAAFWPSNTTLLENIDYSRMCVGVVQFFLHHNLAYYEHDEVIRKDHIFAYVLWKKCHREFDYFGRSAIVCENEYERSSSSCFLPVQRICYRCVHGIMPVNFGSITETVFIACPIRLNYML